MPFNSVSYLLFYIATLCGCWLLAGRPRLRILFLLGASYFFYAANNSWILLILLLSTGMDFYAGLKVGDNATSPGRRKAWLIASVAANLGLLGFFKYTKFFLKTFGLPPQNIDRKSVV